MDIRPIGMLDSGVGGLTVYKEVRNMFPYEDIVYFGDTKNFPYGSKSKESIIELAKQGVEFLISQNVKLIVIACGTATSQALDELKMTYDIPIIGIIEPTAKVISNNVQISKVGIIATAGTIKSKCWESTLLKFNSLLEIQSKACPMLAPMAEEGWTNNEIAKLAIKEYVKDFDKIDALILGCTHYPLYINILENLLPDVNIINPGKIIAEELEKMLDKNLLNENTKNGITRFFLSDLECNFIEVAKRILNVQEIKIESKINN